MRIPPHTQRRAAGRCDSHAESRNRRSKSPGDASCGEAANFAANRRARGGIESNRVGGGRASGSAWRNRGAARRTGRSPSMRARDATSLGQVALGRLEQAMTNPISEAQPLSSRGLLEHLIRLRIRPSAKDHGFSLRLRYGRASATRGRFLHAHIRWLRLFRQHSCRTEMVLGEMLSSRFSRVNSRGTWSGLPCIRRMK